MGGYLIHNEGAYNFYSNISDRALFESALTLEQLKKYYKEEFGDHGMKELGERLDRAHETGTSAVGDTLKSTIMCNRAGENESKPSNKDFIDKFLTIRN